MDLCDIGVADHGERTRQFLDDLAGKDPNRRAEVSQVARDMASVEMLDEIHVMLRELLRRTAALPL